MNTAKVLSTPSNLKETVIPLYVYNYIVLVNEELNFLKKKINDNICYLIEYGLLSVKRKQ